MIYEEEGGDITLAFAGDALISRKLDVYREERFLALAQIFRDADASFCNAETLFHRFESPPKPETGAPGAYAGTYAQCDPRVISDLKWLGIDMVSTANNHAIDYGEGGVLDNIRYLEEFEMAHAGTGPSLAEASAPAYLDTPKGSVALIGVTMSLPGGHYAGDARGPTRARPGVNGLRTRRVNVLPREEFNVLGDVATALNLGGFGLANDPRRWIREGATDVVFAGHRFVPGDSFHHGSELDPADLARNLKWVSEARRQAEWVVVSVHCHEGGATNADPSPAMQTFARACIDAGADAVFGHGPHRDRGIEIYQGKPIMYSLATLALHNDVMKWQPNDLFNKLDLPPDATPADAIDSRSGGGAVGADVDSLQTLTCAVTARYQSKELCELVVHPMDLGFATHNRRMRGRPTLATAEAADEVLTRMQSLCSSLGTDMKIDNERGVITVA